MQRTLLQSMLAAFEKEPVALLVALKSDITDTIDRFSAGPRTGGRRELVSHLCWAVGAYAGPPIPAALAPSLNISH